MRKRLVWVDGFLCLAALAVAAAVTLERLTPRPGVTPENFKRLHKGMTEQEAEAILGRKADGHLDGGGRGHNVSWWHEGECHLGLWSPPFGLQSPSSVMDGHMVLPDGSTLPLREKPGNWPLDKLRAWLGWK
jgi:hypothetical protein